MITPAQCRAARALLNMPRERLAETARVPVPIVTEFEDEQVTPDDTTLGALQAALEADGVLFERAGETHHGGAGVRMRGKATGGGIRPEDLTATNDD